jgi:hypothetical protein
MTNWTTYTVEQNAEGKYAWTMHASLCQCEHDTPAEAIACTVAQTMDAHIWGNEPAVA